MDVLFAFGFGYYFYHWKSSIRRNKAFLCAIATSLGFANLLVYNWRVYREPHLMPGALVSLTNSYMKVYLVADMCSMICRSICCGEAVRKDMVFHHSLTITAFVFKNNLGMAFTPCAEIISIWEFWLPREPVEHHLHFRMVSISSVRLFVWISLLGMLWTAKTMTSWSDRCFCVVVPCFMLPLDAYWYLECKRKLRAAFVSSHNK